MKKNFLTSVVLLSSLLAAQMSMSVHAAEDAGDVLLISPAPADTQTQTESTDTGALLGNQYEQYAGLYTYDGVALQLNSIEVLLGGGNGGFDLYNLPDRQQASVMVVRMRGEVDAALAAYEAGEISCPFADVDDWAKPYIAWLYEKGITQGSGDGIFGNRICTAQEYVTFMLRALGYSVTWAEEDSTDVLFADVLQFSRGIGLWDDCLAAEPEFNRGVMSAVTYQTLGAESKDSDERLLYTLAQAGAINIDKAEPILALYDKVDAATAMERASVPAAEGGLRLTGKMIQDEYVTYTVIGGPDGDTAEAAYNGLNFDVGIDMTADSPSLAMEGEISAVYSDMNLSVPMGMWLHEGSIYIDVMGQKNKEDITDTASMDTVSQIFGNITAMMADTGSRYYTVTDVTIETTDGTDGSLPGTVITYDMSDFMWQIIAMSAQTESFTENAELLAQVVCEKYLDENGVLSWVYSGMYAGISETYTEDTAFSVEILSETVVSYTAWGEDARLTYPDFSQFEAAVTA